MAACRLYPFARETSKHFAQELIQYALTDFGHTWTAKRTDQEKRLRGVSMFTFTPEIGKVVVYFSRKHADFLLLACYDTWKYIKSHRTCVLQQLLCNEIVSLCQKCDLEEDDDFGLFIFMAMAAEYARFAIVDDQEQLVDAIVKALSYCLTNVIPGGFIETLDRMQHRAETFDLPEYINIDGENSEISFINEETNSDSVNVTSGFESPLNFTSEIPVGVRYCTPLEFKNCELNTEFLKPEMKVNSYTQTDIVDNPPHASYLDNVQLKFQDLEVCKSEEMKKRQSLSGCYAEGGPVRVSVQDASVQTENEMPESSRNMQNVGNEIEGEKSGSLEVSMENTLIVPTRTEDSRTVNAPDNSLKDVVSDKKIEKVSEKSEVNQEKISRPHTFDDVKEEQKEEYSQE